MLLIQSKRFLRHLIGMRLRGAFKTSMESSKMLALLYVHLVKTLLQFLLTVRKLANMILACK